MPPAPALANRRVAMWPASVISVLARMPMRPEPSSETARNRMMWPANDRASSASERQPPGIAVGDAAPDVGEAGQGGSDDHEAGDERHGEAAEHQELPRRDARGERGAVLDGGHEHRLPRTQARRHWASPTDR